MEPRKDKTNNLTALWNQVDSNSEPQLVVKRTLNTNEGDCNSNTTASNFSDNTLQKHKLQNAAKVEDSKQLTLTKKNFKGSNSSLNKNSNIYPVSEQKYNIGAIKKFETKNQNVTKKGGKDSFNKNHYRGEKYKKEEIKRDFKLDHQQKDVPSRNDGVRHSSGHNSTQNMLQPAENKNAVHLKKDCRVMSFRSLQTLTTKTTSEILLTIVNKESGFSMLLNQDMKRDAMAYILLALGKAVDCYMNKNVMEMILSVTSNSSFFLVKIQQYLVSFQMQKPEDCHLSSLLSLTIFLHKFQISLPSNAADVLLILLPLLKQTCEKYLVDHAELHCAVSQKLGDIEEQNSLVLEKYNATEIKHTSQKEKMQLMKPPEDFRSIPVLPTAGDILQECAFLRPNIVKGKYQDTEHYLDVQYRLLREDYVRPLRDGISEYMKLKRQGKSLKHCKNVRVYSDVHIVKEEFVNGGLVHMAYFNEQNFSKIKWDYSKRFLSGSLLCFSSDDFKTMLFASVARRDAKELSKGLLLVHFEELTDKVLNIGPLINFVVVETSAYFEAYRHNLKALHELKEESLPMKQYIIDIQKNTQKPLYLDESTTYDMRPLLLPLNCECVEEKINTLPVHISEKTQNVKILDEASWPSAADLNLDPSQYAAFKAAITREFSVLQGPPGTGKTYVGLKIAQVLLHNIKKWHTDSKQLPILVICYTNHALDQFLEGLLMFTKKLVRVGGRGINETISQYQLNNLKRAIKMKREVPHYIFSNMSQKLLHLKSMRTDIEKIQKSSEKSYKSVLSDNILIKYMSKQHVYSLRSIRHYLKDDGYLLHDWLGIRIRDTNTESGNLMTQNNKARLPKQQTYVEEADVNLYSDEESEAEADIDYIENQRAINTDEFQDASYDFEVYEEESEWVPYSQGEWQMQGGEKKLQHYIVNQLRRNPAMLEPEASTIQDIWTLPIEQRWRLYNFWLQFCTQDKEKEILKLQQEVRKEFEKLTEMRTEEDIYVCEQAHVVGMTTTGASKYRHIVQQLNPKIVIVEEAAEILESHIVTSLAPGTQHVILIGDHQQLRPNPTVHLLAVKYDLNVSLFERMVENGMDCHKLGIQHRMRPEIASLISPHIYNDLQNHNSVTKFENIKGVLKNVFFVSHAYNELQESDSKSKVNQHEAKFIIKLCKYFINQGYSSSQITVLTTYSGQLFEMKRLNQGIINGVKFTVVDNYQGEENDIILISFVRSNEEGEIGFLKIANRVCVALSRAKKGLFCIGNFKLLAEKSELWRNIVEQLEKDNAIGPSLQLTCQNHPEVSNVVASESDFNSVPEGGCIRQCEFRLPCGHVCQLMCHPYDQEHEDIKCSKPCTKTCDEGHLCQRKCSQECGPCKVIVTKTIELCGHTINVECHKKKEKMRCIKLCDKYLECGHMCTKLCWEPCVLKCVEKVNVKSILCGHKVHIECFDYENKETLAKICREPCRKELSCGHMCQGTCSRCHQGRIHTSCTQPCKRILVCGHECKSTCSKSCPPCKRKCENRCPHSKCPKTCGEPCDKCTEPCEWSCAHKKCNRPCGEQCDRTSCNEPCLKKLKCKHQCIGLCGEPCPKKCRICHEEKVKEIFFGSEEELDALFITLEDCNHIFELNGITQWMNHDINEKREIQMKTCPKCKVVIRRNLHFGNIVKLCLADIEKVKKLTYGVALQNREFQKALLQRLKDSGLLLYTSPQYKPLIAILESGKSRSIQEITKMENMVTILLSLQTVSQSFSSIKDSLESRMREIRLRFGLRNRLRRPLLSDEPPKEEFPLDTDTESSLTKLKGFIRKTVKWLTIFIGREFLTASDQQMQELTWEAHRVKLASNLLNLLIKEPKIQTGVPLDSLLELIMSEVPFGEVESKKFISDLESYVKLIGGAQINVTELEKQSILKAMGLSKGHWYQCPNGHVYCITECGGAMQEGKCNECGENIGGTQHHLLPTNRVATAMDGAQHAAWSDAMNMENYRF